VDKILEWLKREINEAWDRREDIAMKKHVLMTIILFSLIFLCAYPAPAQADSGPKMVLKEREFDCGEVKEGEVIEHTFSVLNQGDEPLEIVRVKPG
jgi:hypothetical protein